MTPRSASPRPRAHSWWRRASRRAPQPTLVLVAGEEAAATFARNVASYVGDEHVLHFPARSDHPFDGKPANPRQAARRMEAAWALQSARPVIVVASATALLRTMPPASAQVARPLSFRQGDALDAGDMPGVASFDDVARALEARGYQNTGELEGHGTFCVRGGAIDVYPGNLVYPVRLDFFGDELDEIRRIVPSTGQTIATLGAVEIYPAQEFQLDAVGIARVRKKLARPAESNPALREVLEKLEGGARFDGADVLLPYLYDEVASLPAYADPAVRAEDASADFPEPACARPLADATNPRARRTRRRPLIATSSPVPGGAALAFRRCRALLRRHLPRGRRARTSRSRGCTRPRRSWTSARGSA